MSAAELARPISASEVKTLFRPLVHARALVLAVSGGPDSTALLVLAARWRQALKKGPKLLAVTIDHGLRPESACEARAVKRLARRLGVPHRTLCWEGKKPNTGLQEAARRARYQLLAQAARSAKASHILTAHTLDDQAETVLIRMSRGSGITGLGGMKKVTPLFASRLSRRASSARRRVDNGGANSPGLQCELSLSGPDCKRVDEPEPLLLARPLLEIPKPRLVATLHHAKVEFADDASNRDPRFARARLRGVMPALAREGLDAERIALFARRLRRAESALENAVDLTAAQLSQRPWADGEPIVFDAEKFVRLPAEVALRLLGRAIAHIGDEGAVQLGKLEKLYEALARAKATGSVRFRRTLAGALLTLSGTRLEIERAPARRRRAS